MEKGEMSARKLFDYRRTLGSGILRPGNDRKLKKEKIPLRERFGL
jgi:hypothetical protein